MSSLRKFIVVELASIAALLLVDAGMAVYGAIDSMSHDNSLIDPRGSAWLGFAYTAMIGAVPVIFFGAPIYLALLHRGSANWLNVLMLGATPGLLLLFVAGGLGLWAMLCGVAVASITHLTCRRLGPNNSFKPNPLRGSA
jgi:hypothetical protein